MINDEQVMKSYQAIEDFFLKKYEGDIISPFKAQVFSGESIVPADTLSVGCPRHKLLFRTYGVIPEVCFNCYKIEIQPKKVVDLFKLAILFKRLSFEKNNSRKCFLRPRKDVSSHYSGLIYFKGTTEPKLMLKKIEPVLRSEIGENIPFFIKRGCTDYSKLYPAYAELDENYEPKTGFNEKWRKIEEQFNKEGVANQLGERQKSPYPNGFGFHDFLSMRTWLSYAKTIGDDSYKKVTTGSVEPIPGLDPAPFISE
ncbi:hypothetical protein QQM79_00035 [Marinobacteraceae bacterium S3BR75-40.1]